MSLNWNLSRCKEEVSAQGCTGLAETLIFATMFVGISRITEENAVEFFTRCKLFECAHGTLRSRWEPTKNEDGTTGERIPVPVTLEEVRYYIGLSTNAASITKAKFLANIYKAALDKAA